METTPQDFFESFVYENYLDCERNKGSIRYAFNAAVSASHMADHYFNYNEKHDISKIKQFKKSTDFIKFLSKETNDCFKDIRSIANAYKHLYNTPKKAMYSTICSPGVLESITFNDRKLNFTKIEEDYSFNETNNFETRVVFTRKDGKRIDFFTTLDTVIKFWQYLLR